MHFFVLGGSGRTGQVLVEEALAQKHTVTALSRDPSKIAANTGLTVLKGNCYVKGDIEAAFSNPSVPDAVLVTLNSTDSGSPFSKQAAPPDTLERSNRNVVEIMKKHGVKKIVVLQAMGIGDSFQNLNFLMRFVINHSAMSSQFADHYQTLRMLQEEGRAGSIQWVTPRPPMLKGIERLPVKTMGDEGKGAGFMPSCSRGSVAKFMIDAAQSDTWDGRTPVIIN